MFDRITHGRKLKSQRYGKKGENQKGMGKVSGLAYLVSESRKKSGDKSFRFYLRFINS